MDFPSFKAAAFAVLCVALAAPAAALPGDSAATVAAAMKHKGFTVTSNISELGGNRVYQAYTTYRGFKTGFFFQAALGGRSYAEILNYDAPGFLFLRRGDARGAGVLALVYDASVASDFRNARLVDRAGVFQSKQKISFLRGRRLGYAASGSQLTVFALKNLANEIANAKACATHECGD